MQIVHSTEKNLPLLAPEKFIIFNTFNTFNTFDRFPGNPRRPASPLPLHLESSPPALC